MRNSKVLPNRNLNLQKSLLLPIVVIFLIGCQKQGSEETIVSINKEHGEDKYVSSFNHQQVPPSLLTLSAQAQKEVADKTQLPKENLYGKFFGERAEFYIIKEPKNKLYEAKVKSLT